MFGRRSKVTTYKDAGVDIQAGQRAVEMIKEKVRATFRPEVVSEIGGFGGLFAFDPGAYKEPVLVSATDGVGTKSLIAQKMGIHDTIGIDLVAMCVDDVAAHGAEPLFFLDYIAIGKLDEGIVVEIIEGITRGCKEAGCALIGGETAEHPGAMAPGSYDLAGFCVGVADRKRLVTGDGVAAGDVIVGVESSGLHSNGYSLVRKILLDEMAIKLEDHPMELGVSLGEELLRPTIVYAPVIRTLTGEVAVRGIAHITGGGIPGNVERVIPHGLTARIDRRTWETPPIFGLVSSLGGVTDDEMFATFNMGIGIVVVVAEGDTNRTLDILRSNGHRAHEIGVVTASRPDETRVVVG